MQKLNNCLSSSVAEKVWTLLDTAVSQKLQSHAIMKKKVGG